ncbi:helix-turn-helix domain-containing protein [Kushneria phosphatilytica]|nr:helix-turn-helix domain-containing protein [Kushneria phosphatilytica]
MSDAQFEPNFLNRLMSVCGVEQDRDLAIELGVPTSTVSNWRSRGNIPIKQCIRIAKEKGVSLDWLILGDRVSSEFESLTSPVEGYTPVPIYDIEAAAGDGRLFEVENIETSLYFDTEQLKHDGLDPIKLVGVRVRGDSMDTTLQDGDRVLVDCSSKKPDGVFLLRMDDGLRIKRVQRVAGGAYMLISDNSRYQPEMIKPEEMGGLEIIGECRVRIGRIS